MTCTYTSLSLICLSTSTIPATLAVSSVLSLWIASLLSDELNQSQQLYVCFSFTIGSQKGYLSITMEGNILQLYTFLLFYMFDTYSTWGGLFIYNLKIYTVGELFIQTRQKTSSWSVILQAQSIWITPARFSKL